jgi:pyrroline-5-carboxylate reductase
MPNTPSAIGLGMSGIFAEQSVARSQVQEVEAIMQSVGKTLVVEQEAQINTVIAAAGSSPAYFFLIAEVMQKAAIEMGLNAADARMLVEQAMLGSATLMQNQADLELSTLRAHVTSKGGTTAKAVESLQEDDIQAMFAKAMQAAVTRANEMSKQF